MNNGQNEIGSGGNGGAIYSDGNDVERHCCAATTIAQQRRRHRRRSAAACSSPATTSAAALTIADTTMTGNTGGHWTQVQTGSVTNAGTAVGTNCKSITITNSTIQGLNGVPYVTLRRLPTASSQSDFRYCDEVGLLVGASGRATCACRRSRPPPSSVGGAAVVEVRRVLPDALQRRRAVLLRRAARRVARRAVRLRLADDLAADRAAAVRVGEARRRCGSVAHFPAPSNTTLPRGRGAASKLPAGGAGAAMLSWYACSAGSFDVTRSSVPLVTLDAGARLGERAVAAHLRDRRRSGSSTRCRRRRR